MRIDLNEIENRIDAGLIRRQWTPDKSLQILNYTMKCSIERHWDEFTILTRGLILTKDGRVHSRSFKKFFNLGEPCGVQITDLPAEIPVITQKLDGYLGIAYWYEGKVRIASRGSFDSEYALWATAWFRSHADPEALRQMDKVCEPQYTWVDQTLVFEILHPKRIVVDNSRCLGLHLLAVIDNETGKEDLTLYDEDWKDTFADRLGFKFVTRYKGTTLGECMSIAAQANGTEQEGFCCYYPNAELRMKVKGDDYCRIHRIATKLTDRRVWELLSRSEQKSPESIQAAYARIAEIKQALPEEYSKWISKTAAKLWMQYAGMYSAYMKTAAVYRRRLPMFRKDLVALLQSEVLANWQVILTILDGKDRRVRDYIWKSLRPEHSPALLQDGEDE